MKNIKFKLFNYLQRRNPYLFLKKSRAFQKYSPDVIRDYQTEKIRAITGYALKHVLYYRKRWRDLNLDTESLTIESFSEKVPLLPKEEVKEKPEDFISEKISLSSLREVRTGGSTGLPMRFFKDKGAVSRTVSDCQRCREWWGIHFTDRTSLFWGHSASFAPGFRGKIAKAMDPVKDFMMSRVRFSAYKMSPEDMSTYLRKMEKFQPEVIIGYASTLYIISDFINENNLKLCLSRLKGVISCAEILYEWQREQITRAFSVPVINEFGMVEVGLIAYECPGCGLYHTMDDHLLIEVINTDKYSSNGKIVGEVVLTTLLHDSAPLIRYQTGDLAELPSEPSTCSLDINLKQLKSVIGRTHDLIVSPKGGYVHGEFFTHIFDFVEGVERFKVVQKTPHRLNIKVVPVDHNARPKLDFVENKINEVFGEDVEIKIDIVEHITGERSGKYRWVVSEICDGQTNTGT